MMKVSFVLRNMVFCMMSYVFCTAQELLHLTKVFLVTEAAGDLAPFLGLDNGMKDPHQFELPCSV